MTSTSSLLRGALLCGTVLGALGCGGPRTAEPPPDLIAMGRVHAAPPEHADDAAVWVRGGRVVRLGDAAEARAAAGPNTVVLEATRVTPGFVDAHAHPLGLGQRLAELDLAGATTYADTLARIAAAEGDGWLTGRGWDQNRWADAPEGGWPRAVDLDARVGDRPVALRRVDGHAVWVSSAVLRAAGVSAQTPDPPGGRILRDADGAPSGVLIDAAMALVPPPTPSDATRRAWALAAMEAMHTVGLVGAHAMGMDDATLATWQALADDGALTIRLRVYVDPGTDAARRLASSGPWGDEHLRVVGVKAYADGALGSRGAHLAEDYADEAGVRGNALARRAELESLAEALLAHDAQLAVHAIGDAAVTEALDALAAARAAHPDASTPLRIEHAQVVRPEDRARFAALGVIASVQPTHATSDMGWAQARLGPERIAWAYTWRGLADAGARLALGSDFPVEAHDPGLGLWAATTRTDRSGNPPGGWRASERLTLDEAIAGFTTGAAFAAGERGGTLQVGQPADLTLWSVEPDGAWRATATVVDGEVRWRATP